MLHGRPRFALAVYLCALAACGDPPTGDPTMDGDVTPQPDAGPMCQPLSETEASCNDGVDGDCDGYRDCFDTECEGRECADGFTCTAGGCLRPGTGLPPLPQISNVRVTMRGDTAIIE